MNVLTMNNEDWAYVLVPTYSKAFIFTILQEHQNILKNASISRDSDIENVLDQWKNIYFKASSLVQ